MDKECEFDFETGPVVREGMSTVRARKFLNQELPEIKSWTCWGTAYNWNARYIGRIPVGKKNKRGTFKDEKNGKWAWQEVPSSYPTTSYWAGLNGSKNNSCAWTGIIKITPPKGKEFILFSFLNADGKIGKDLFASTHNYNLLSNFAKAANEHFSEKSTMIPVNSITGKAYMIDPNETEKIFMQEDIRGDIEAQVHSFFSNRAFFKKHNIRYKRGFLLVGPPGTGKTLMTRHIIREAWKKFNVSAGTIRPSMGVDEDVLEATFDSAVRSGPSILVLEDVDTLTKETRITRSGLLSMLDGLEAKEGVLVIASTNNPQDIDPALIHRPSRFDRVFHFPLPNYELREAYCSEIFEEVSPALLRRIVAESEGWSFAYLNELRSSAALKALSNGFKTINDESMEKTLDILNKQFKAGQKNHVECLRDNNSVGFTAA